MCGGFSHVQTLDANPGLRGGRAFRRRSAFAADTIKLGVAGAHSGELASYGTPSLNAAMLVAEEFNAKGGVMGKQVEIVAQDDLCKAEVATAAATKQISDGVAAVMGHICSGPCKATLPLYTNANMISMVAFRDHPLPDPERPEPHVFPHHRQRQRFRRRRREIHCRGAEAGQGRHSA